MTHPQIDTASLGKVALFYQQNMLRFAYITEIDGNRLHLTGTEGEGYTLVPARLLLVSRDLRAQNPEALKSFYHQALGLSETMQALPLAGETFSEICQKYQIETDLWRFALYLHLKQQSLLYQQKHEKFYRLSEEQTKLLKTKQIAKQERQNWLKRLTDYLAGKGELNRADGRLLRQELRAYLQGEKTEDLEKVLKDFAGEKGGQNLAIRLRRSLGETAQDPIFEASGMPIAFEEDYPLAEAVWEALPVAEHSAFSIDDEDSQDYDDAISLEKREAGYCLGIHISLVARQIEAETALFREALYRVSSLYLPPETISMLPPQYVQERFSLKSGRIMPVISQYFYLDRAYEIIRHELKLERIGISRNFSYNEVARRAMEKPFETLIQIAKLLKEKRENYEEKLPYYQVYIKCGKLQMRKIDPQSPGRVLIEELMILYNSTIAWIYAKAKLPLIYRNINKYYDAQQQYATNTAYLSTTPEYHPGIGAGAYLHASSPIRRVVDLINQMQIICHLQGDALCFSQTELQSMIAPIEKRILQIRELMQQSERYWFLKYIEQNELHNPLKAWHRGYVNGKLKVELMPWGKTVLMINEAMPQEESFHIVVYEVDWGKNCLVGDLIE